LSFHQNCLALLVRLLATCIALLRFRLV